MMALALIIVVLVVIILAEAAAIAYLKWYQASAEPIYTPQTDSIYYTDRGTVAHSSRKCPAIRASVNVKVLSLCKKCSSHLRVAAWVETQKDD